jgi:hypothetical protein
MELGTNSRRGKVMRLTIKYWYRILCMDVEDPVKQFYEWQTSNISVISWDEDLKEEQWSTGVTSCGESKRTSV